ncbi:MAG: hypothetical protein FD181_488 [Prolixibacteraceae bacterium]|nr:MAG: hypothetical protein FD181_488 [Prolixibacteraceae bacterium]
MAGARLILFENRLKKDGTTVVYAQVHIDNESIRINTGVCVAPDRFDKIKGRAKGTGKQDCVFKLYI